MYLFQKPLGLHTLVSLIFFRPATLQFTVSTFYCMDCLESLDQKILLTGQIKERFQGMDNFTWLSSPRRMSMTKKRIAQTVGAGIRVIALGYAMKARPGPAKKEMCEKKFKHKIVTKPT